jgi:hypothetical protein
VVYLDINLAKVAMWLYGYLPGYIDIQIISPTYLDIDMRARISVDIDIRRSGDENKLEEKDWAIVSLFDEVLQHFEHVLITLEGDGQQHKRKEGYIEAYGCPWDALLGYEYLLGKMEVYKAAAHRYTDLEHFKVNVNLCWKKLDKYYSRLDETPVYYAAIALYPAYRWEYFEDVWADRPDWIQTAKSLVEELYRSHYEPRIISRDRERGEPVSKKRRIYRNPLDEYREESRQAPTLLQPPSSMTTLLQAEVAANSSTYAVGDEYSDWFRDVHKSDQNILDPISYWYERREEYPRLSQMALGELSVLPMSADVERLFSICGRMVRDDRARLDASTIGMTQTVRSWLCGGYIKNTEKLLEDAKVPGTDLLAEMSFAEAREATGPLLASISIHSIQGGPKWTSIHSTRGYVDGNGMDRQPAGQ